MGVGGNWKRRGGHYYDIVYGVIELGVVVVDVAVVVRLRVLVEKKVKFNSSMIHH